METLMYTNNNRENLNIDVHREEWYKITAHTNESATLYLHTD
jgi:hypothetical protein